MSNVVENDFGGALRGVKLEPNAKLIAMLDEEALEAARSGQITSGAYVGFGLREPVTLAALLSNHVATVEIEAHVLCSLIEREKLLMLSRTDDGIDA